MDPKDGGGRVFLLGLMGAGKSTVGTALADRLGCAYRDNDELLAARTGLDAVALRHQGDAILHDAESAQLRALLTAPPPFVAGVAASVAERPDDLALLTAAGTLVYLRARPETLSRRVGLGEGRPYLDQDRTTVIAEMFARRDPVLRRADIVVDTDDLPPAQVAADIARRLTPCGPGGPTLQEQEGPGRGT